MVNTYFGRLTFDVKMDIVGTDKKKVLNNRIAMRLSKNQTTYIDVVAWEATAELINKHFKKGYEILFQGKIINKKKSIGNGIEVDGNALLIDEVIFTTGNPKEGIAGQQEEDFLK